MGKDVNLFGEEIEKKFLLRDKYIEPPFSVLDTKGGAWRNRKVKWKKLGIKSEVGRAEGLTFKMSIDEYRKKDDDYLSKQKEDFNTSVFDPVLCEILYRWFVPENGTILDPFAGGSVRGIVANYLGYNYTGIDIRREQIESNYEQGREIVPANVPNWITGDSDIELEILQLNKQSFDFVFSCPPYADLEVYSDLQGDISNMDYPDFLTAYESIIKKSCSMLKAGGYACFVIGEVRDKKGNFYGFVPDTINAFKKAGLQYYNEAILLNPVASASMRADKQFSAGKKLVKIHQNVLIFKK